MIDLKLLSIFCRFKVKLIVCFKRTFWVQIEEKYAIISEAAIRYLLPFASTYLYETMFSSLIYLKNKYRNKLEVESDLPLALTKIGVSISFIYNSKTGTLFTLT